MFKVFKFRYECEMNSVLTYLTLRGVSFYRCLDEESHEVFLDDCDHRFIADLVCSFGLSLLSLRDCNSLPPDIAPSRLP